MTALTLAPQPAKEAAPRPVPWRNMLWVTWRQHRATLISVPAVLGAVGVFLWIAGLRIHHNYAVLMACHPATSNACQTLNGNFNSTDWTMANIISILMQLGPALIGAFAGGSLLARELETGTYRYAWTQGFGRARWTIAKLVIVAVTITVSAFAFSELFTWFFKPFLAQEDLTVLSATVFAREGIAYAAWTLLAFSVGALAGMFFRRTVPAMAVTLGIYAGLAILTWTVLRKHYPVALVTSGRIPFYNGPLTPNTPWVLSTWTSGRTSWASYVPVSRFWPMQLIEGGWLLALSVVCFAATVWLVRRRAA
jgi:ABC-type transport system involved in multi-copper enzyme maturation permease subunit